MTIAEVKRDIYDKKGIKTYLQELYFKNDILNDYKTLKDYIIKKEDEL